VFLGAHAVNPVNGELIPIWAADYVLMEYGTGAIMAVPAHDQRDLEFARKYRLPVRVVVQPPGQEPLDGSTLTEAMSHEGVLVNSGPYDGLPATEEGIPRITADLEARGLGGPAVNFRLRDWLLSRQRYWGCPIPIVHCPACGEVPVPDEQLPVLLPEDVTDFRPKGRSPLATSEAWVNVDCPRCGGPARRETDTMDTFVDSSWYFLRYTGLDPERPFDPGQVAKWMPVEQYTGGIEHAILHLLYARFFTKVLCDMGLVGFSEPFTSLLNQGMVVMHGAAMSKSRGNLVEPSEIIDEHGADVARLTMLFAGPFEDDVDWADVSPEGMARWIQRVWRAVHAAVAEGAAGAEDLELARLAHRTTAGVTDDLERFRFNTAISKLMVLSNGLADAVRAGRASAAQRRDAAERLVLLLAPLAPFITEELWRGALGKGTSVHVSAWPTFDPDLVRQERATCVLQVDGKVRDRIEVATDASEDELRDLAMASEKVRAALGGRPVARVVVVPPKLVNLVTAGTPA
jgi:leucyl-tRNA synthetase